MELIKDFSDLEARLRLLPIKPKVAVVCPDDCHTQQVIERALEQNIVDVTLVDGGLKSKWTADMKSRYGHSVTLLSSANAESAAIDAVGIVRQGGCDVLMKGRINTDVLLRAVLDKKHGLLEPGRVLSHIAVTRIPSYPKLLLFMDAAVIPNPTLVQFRTMLSYGTDVCRRLGIEKPCVALINCTEKISDTFPNTHAYATLIKEAADGAFGDIVLDGPMDVKTACDRNSGLIKGITLAVAGNADMLVFPDIQAGNTFYKTITLFAGASLAGMICGTTKPVVLSSRADSTESKFHSLVLACALYSNKGNAH